MELCATLSALYAMAMGDLETARVELKRAQFAQEDAEARFADRIAKARKKMEAEHADVARLKRAATSNPDTTRLTADLRRRFARTTAGRILSPTG